MPTLGTTSKLPVRLLSLWSFPESLSACLQNINLAFSLDKLYKEGIALAEDLLEQDKLDACAPLTHKGLAPPRPSREYPIRDQGQPSGGESWSDGRTPVPNNHWARSPTASNPNPDGDSWFYLGSTRIPFYSTSIIQR